MRLHIKLWSAHSLKTTNRGVQGRIGGWSLYVRHKRAGRQGPILVLLLRFTLRTRRKKLCQFFPSCLSASSIDPA